MRENSLRFLLLLIFEDGAQGIRFAVGEIAKFAGEKIAERQGAESNPFQFQHRMADDFKHTLDLMLSALVNCHFEP